MRLAFDIETNGLMPEVDTLHCLVIKDIDTGEITSLMNDKGFSVGLDMLSSADLIIGHNIIKYDLPVLQKICPWFTYDETKVFDTLTASRLMWTNLFERDVITKRIEKKLYGSHGLEAWGCRLGEWKGDYSKEMKANGLNPWAEWNQEMQDYCVQDVEVTHKFFKLIESKKYSKRALDIEHQMQFIIAQVERNGYAFDVEVATKLFAELSVEREQRATALRDLFQPWYKPDGLPKEAKVNRLGDGITKGCIYQKLSHTVFNPNSDEQIADRLMVVNGWKPTKFTPGGRPKIDETVLRELPYPEAQTLAEYRELQKVITQLGDGPQAWLKKVKDGRIYGSYNINGTVTGRATHSHPNIGQVPSVSAFKGAECRELFGQPTQLGCDVSGLELRMLAHYMRDDDYTADVVEGDIHTRNMKAAGLSDRNQAKTFIYAFLYGAGNQKIGSIVGQGPKTGGKLRKSFLEQTPSLKRLINGVKNTAKLNGAVNALDGRQIHIKSPHSALNFLLQSAGAIVCKVWIIEFVRLLKEAGVYQDGVQIVAWVHDEIQMELADSVNADDIGKPVSYTHLTLPTKRIV